MTPYSKQTIPEGKKVYFASDFHLGVNGKHSSFEREKIIINWLEEIKPTAHCVFLVGDIFDFWFEYKHAIPKGFVRFQACIAKMVDEGIPVYVFSGNHDMWMFDYLEKELGVTIFHQTQVFEFNNHVFYIGHGDGLGPKDFIYKFLKLFFRSALCQWLFARIHPNLGIGFAKWWSGKSRLSHTETEEKFKGDDEWLLIYCTEQEQIKHHDYYIFGHRHLPLDLKIGNNGARYINLGEWVNFYTYASYDGKNLDLKEYL